jgi:hypothetical protein
VAVYVWFLVQVYASHPLESRAGLLFIALGVPVYWLNRRAPARTLAARGTEGV